jgi:hypothetical protein
MEDGMQSICGGGEVPNVTKLKVPASQKKKTVGRTAKLKLSKWYQAAAKSIGITKERSLDSRHEMFK